MLKSVKDKRSQYRSDDTILRLRGQVFAEKEMLKREKAELERFLMMMMTTMKMITMMMTVMMIRMMIVLIRMTELMMRMVLQCEKVAGEDDASGGQDQ